MCAVQGQRQQKPPELGKVPCGRICKTLNFRQHKHAAAGVMDRATRQLQQNLTAAIDRLGAIVADDEETSANHITAARTLLDYGLKFTEFNDILKELEEGGEDVL